ncbi:hypothetical protein ABEF95_008894 [Exophiala dermatitidis]
MADENRFGPQPDFELIGAELKKAQNLPTITSGQQILDELQAIRQDIATMRQDLITMMTASAVGLERVLPWMEQKTGKLWLVEAMMEELLVIMGIYPNDPKAEKFFRMMTASRTARN